jgi:hypothetical protein
MRNRSVRIGAAWAFTPTLRVAAPLAAVSLVTLFGASTLGTRSAWADDKSTTGTATATVPATAKADVNVNVTAPIPWDESDVTEKDGHKYYFVGLRYRGYVIPKAFINIFVSGGQWVYSQAAGIELDIRKDGFSIIPNITYNDYSTPDLLFLQHGEVDTNPGNWSLVNSSLKVLYLGSDFLWSAKLSKNVDFEYGMGFGLGVVFGSLEDNWVHPVNSGTPGALYGGNVVSGWNVWYAPCQTQMAVGTGCNIADHTNATVAKVGGYNEPGGFNPVPTLFLNVSVPQLGIRIKPIKSFVGRVNVGFNIPNGLWFGFSGDYGLESLIDKK